MDIIILTNSEQPIYEQIKEQIKVLIFSGELKQGDALPSMRTLAKELKISIITTKRAYEELESEGFIESFTGRGSFVRPINRESVREKMLFEIEELYEAILDKADQAQLSPGELETVLRTVEQARAQEAAQKSS